MSFIKMYFKMLFYHYIRGYYNVSLALATWEIEDYKNDCCLNCFLFSGGL